jgi:hypothetical protein
MKELCRMNINSKFGEFQKFKVVVEVSDGVNKEVTVAPYEYSTNNTALIQCGGTKLNPEKLTVSVNDVPVTELLLNIEVCKFVMDSNPELRGNA